jgi:hypothetical protein
MAAFGEGLAAHNIKFKWRNPSPWTDDQGEDFKAVAVVGARGKAGEVISFYKSRGVPVIVIDFGFIDRASRPENYETGHWYVGLDGLGWLTPKDVPGDRLEKLDRLERDGQDSPRTNAPILVCGQVPNDASHGLNEAELSRYYRDLADQIRRQTDREIWFRPHPKFPSLKPRGFAGIDRGPLLESLKGASLVFVLNSNTGLDALQIGRTVITCRDAIYSDAALRWPCTIPSGVTQPRKKTVDAVLRRISYSQWTLEEIRRGDPLNFLKGQTKWLN